MRSTRDRVGWTIAVAATWFHWVAAAEPLKIYILAGQSNMEGHAKVETLDHLADDPETAPMLEEMRGPDGEMKVRQRVWISYLTGRGDENGEGFGKLTAGYGSRRDPSKPGGKIGPELQFGISMEKAHQGPILIIKTAWGGKSLHTDFRPPGAGPYQLNEYQKALYQREAGTHGIPKDMDEWWERKHQATGRSYRLMIEHVRKVLRDPARVCPAYDPAQGFELAGFVWFQGWNDMVDAHTYPKSLGNARYDAYSDLLAQLIRDVRKDLEAPDLPFVIGVMGVGGMQDEPNPFREAMAKPAKLPEFKGSVVVVPTAPYWDESLAEVDSKLGEVRQMARFLRTKHKDHANRDGAMSEAEQRAYLVKFRAEKISAEEEALWKRGASNQGYHYLGSAKTMALIGRAFAESVPSLEE